MIKTVMKRAFPALVSAMLCGCAASADTNTTQSIPASSVSDNLIIDMETLPDDDEIEYTEIDLDMYMAMIRIDIGTLKQPVAALNLCYDDSDEYIVPMDNEPYEEGDYAEYEYAVSLEGPHDFASFVDGETITFTLYLYSEFSEEKLPTYTRADSIGSVTFDYTFHPETEEAVYLLTQTEDGQFHLEAR